MIRHTETLRAMVMSAKAGLRVYEVSNYERLCPKGIRNFRIIKEERGIVRIIEVKLGSEASASVSRYRAAAGTGRRIGYVKDRRDGRTDATISS